MSLCPNSAGPITGNSIDDVSAGPPLRRHVVISGTGRAGTTFLVELLTHLGLDTGFAPEELDARKDQRARAGLERDIRKPDAPYIVKSPSFCDTVREALSRDDIAIDHVLIPMRDLHAAAESRRVVRRSNEAEWSLVRRMLQTVYPTRMRGGLWHTTKGHEQEAVLVQQLYNLLLALSEAAIPVTLLRFPRIVKDREYLFAKLQPILPRSITPDQFSIAFDAAARPDLVHTFNQNDC